MNYEKYLYRDDPEAEAHRADFEPVETDADLIAAGARDPSISRPEPESPDPFGIWRKQLMRKIKKERRERQNR